MDMGEERLDAGDQWFAVEQFADSHGGIKSAGITLTPRPGTEIGIKIGRRRNATRKGAGTRIDQACFR